MNFGLFAEMRARSTPTALAVVDHRHRLNWQELDDLASRMGNYLIAKGLKKGDRFAIYLPNRAEAVIALLGAWKAGVISVPINWRLVGQDLSRIVTHCAASCFVVTSDRADMIQSEGATVLEVGDLPGSGSFWSELERLGPTLTTVPCQNAEIANLLYTSGTTGSPKAAIHTHGMRVSIAAAMAHAFRLSSADVALAVSPLFHTSGFSVFSNAIFAGCPLVLLEKWDLSQFLEVIESEKVTFMHLIATLVTDIAKAPAHLFTSDTRSVRLTWGGGHAVSPDIFERYEQRIGGIFIQGYSRTEGGLTYNHADVYRRRFDSHGVENENSSNVAILDQVAHRPLSVGEVGEIVVRGDGVSPGYWDGEFVRVRPTVNGWHRTGDSGLLETDGSLRFLGRFDDMIKTGGENVYPSEIEAVLLALPEVKNAVVLGIPDARLGQRIAAVIVPAMPGITEAHINSACRNALPGFKVPRAIAFADSLPSLGTQKIDLGACRRLLGQPTATNSPLPR